MISHGFPRLPTTFTEAREQDMTEWQRMTDDERTAYMTQYVGKYVDVITADEWQMIEQPDYPRFSPRWQGYHVQQIDDGGLGRGVLFDGRFWMRYDEIADVRPTQRCIDIPDHTQIVEPGLLIDHQDALTSIIQDIIWYADRTNYEDESGTNFIRSALRMVQALGYSRTELMHAWDEITP